MRDKKWLISVSIGLLCISLSCGMNIAENGKSDAEIVVGETPSSVVKFAARELSEYLGRSGECIIPVKANSSAKIRIYLGECAESKAAGLHVKEHEIFIESRTDGSIFILGFDDSERKEKSISELLFDVEHKGTLEAVYTFLEKHVGIRWLEPGHAGEYVPVKKRLEIPFVSERFRADFIERRASYLNTIRFWQYNGKPDDLDEYATPEDVLLWGLRLRHTSFKAKCHGCHTPAYIAFDKTFFKSNPEWFALQSDGQRSPNDICWSNPEVIDFWVQLADCYFRGDPNPRAAGIPMDSWNPHLFTRHDEFMLDPHDFGFDFICKCRRCSEAVRKYGKDGYGELVFQAIFKVADKIRKRYPGKYITTLVYPPKGIFPKSCAIPENVRVRITCPPLSMDPSSDAFKKSMTLIKQWNSAQKEKVTVWLYVISCFMNRLYGIPEVLPHKFQGFLQTLKPYTNGVFYEHIEPSHTIRNIDLYCYAHLLWDSNLDLTRLLDEYFQLYFGAASQDMRKFYDRLEQNWNKVISLNKTCDGGVNDKSKDLLKPVFDTIYTYRELEELEKILDSALSKIVPGSSEAIRVNRFKRHVLELAQREFSTHSSDKVNRFSPPLLLLCGQIKRNPEEKDWDAAPWQEMVNAKSGYQFSASSKFKVLSTDRSFFVRAVFQEPFMDKSLTRPRQKGDWADIWEDNDTEFFFFSEKTHKLIQILVNDQGVYAVHDVAEKKFYTDIAGIKSKISSIPDAWTLELEVPNSVSGFAGNAKTDKFNMTRTRNIKGIKREYSTWSKDCFVGRWTLPEYFSILLRKPLLYPSKTFQGAALEAQAGEENILFENAVDSGKLSSWHKWVTAPGKSVLDWDPAVGHNGKGSLLIDSRQENADGKDYNASWRYLTSCPKPGSGVRVSAWLMSDTTNPNATIGIAVGWNDKTTRWYTKHDYSGKALVPGENRKWRKVEMDIIVPDTEEIKFMSVSVFGSNIYPGRLWADDLKISIVKTK